MRKDITKKLQSFKDENYLAFNNKLVKSKYPLIGVRLPVLREFGKELLKENIKLEDIGSCFHEEILLRCFIISKQNSFEDIITLIDKELEHIDNWASNDFFVSNLKIIKMHLDDYYPYLLDYLKSEDEYKQRFALVCLLTYYMNDKYIHKIYRIINKTTYHGYYSKMAGAWLLSYCFMFYFKDTLEYLKKNKIDDFVLKKGISKAKDSYRLNKEEKKLLETSF